MKRIILVAALFFIWSLASAAIRPEYSGAWYNTSQTGHGFSLEVISPERSLAFWYAYDPFGNPIFLYAEGTNVGNTIQAQVYYLQGMIWGEFDPDTSEMYDWGQLTITFRDCNNATLQYSSTLTYQSGEEFGSGQMPLVHLASIEGHRCTDYPIAGIYAGSAYSYSDDETYSGWGIVNEQGRITFVSEDGVVVDGQVSVSGGTKGSFSASGKSAYFIAGEYYQTGGFSASGTFNPDMIGVNYNIPGMSDTGWLEIHRLSRWTNSSVYPSDLSGNWSSYNYVTGASVPITVNADGSFLVTDSFGCRYDGRVTIPNAELNVLNVSANVSGCGLASGTFTGNGAYFEDENVYFGGKDAILLIAWNSQGDAAVMELTRN